MIDIWRRQTRPKKEHTYVNNLADFKSRIDRFYLTSELENNYKINTNNTKFPFRLPDDNTNLLSQK